MKYTYEEIPFGLIDRKVRDAVCRAAEFAKADLQIEEVPIVFVRQVTTHREHHGATYELNKSGWYGLAVKGQGKIFIDAERCKDPLDAGDTTLHEYRHFYQYKDGRLNMSSQKELDARQYTKEAPAARWRWDGTGRPPGDRKALYVDPWQTHTRQDPNGIYTAPQKMELRTRKLILTENRSAGDIGTLKGYVIRFNELSEPLGGFVEKLMPGCFTNIGKDDIRALFGHDSLKPLARTGNGSLQLRQDEIGVFAEIKLPDTTYARDLLQIVKDGVATGTSFGFTTQKDFWEDQQTGRALRKIIEARLLEVSLGVTWPAYPTAGVAV